MMDRIALIIRAAMHDAADTVDRSAESGHDPLAAVSDAMRSVDFEHLFSLTSEEACDMVGHNFDASSDGQTCYNCGAEK